MTAWAQKLDRKVGGRRPPLQCVRMTLNSNGEGRGVRALLVAGWWLLVVGCWLLVASHSTRAPALRACPSLVSGHAVGVAGVAMN